MDVIYGRTFIKKPECPFCGTFIERPREIEVRKMGEMPVGACSCGSVYACDVSGRNLGAAFIEALVFGCNMDWYLAWSLLPGEDYTEQIVERYDLKTHSIVPGGFYQGRRIAGSLYFVRFQKDIKDSTLKNAQKHTQKPVHGSSDLKASGYLKRTYSKKDIEDKVKEYEIDWLLKVAGSDKRIIRDLRRILYSGDELLRSRAADALGKVSAVLAEKEPGRISKLLQNLFTSTWDYGTSSWGSMNAIGEIIRNSPGIFAGYIPTLYQFLSEKALQPKALMALGRIAEVRPDLLQSAVFRFWSFLNDVEPENRGYAAWLIGSLGVAEAKNLLEAMLGEEQKINFYHEGSIKERTVGEVAAEALKKIENN